MSFTRAITNESLNSLIILNRSPLRLGLAETSVRGELVGEDFFHDYLVIKYFKLFILSSIKNTPKSLFA